MAHLPDHLPILDRRLARDGCPSVYVEREITTPVDLCDARGRLNPDAVGFSRQPLVRANLSGHWPRKKKWNFWNWIGPDFVFSVTLADIDLASFCSFTLTDFTDGAHWSGASYGRSGRFALPEEVEASVAFQDGGLDYANRTDGADLAVHFRGRARDRTEVAAEFAVRRPPGHESLNVVVPWTSSRFQCNSKHAALPCEGEVRAGDRRYRRRPATRGPFAGRGRHRRVIAPRTRGGPHPRRSGDTECALGEPSTHSGRPGQDVRPWRPVALR